MWVRTRQSSISRSRNHLQDAFAMMTTTLSTTTTTTTLGWFGTIASNREGDERGVREEEENLLVRPRENIILFSFFFCRMISFFFFLVFYFPSILTRWKIEGRGNNEEPSGPPSPPSFRIRSTFCFIRFDRALNFLVLQTCPSLYVWYIDFFLIHVNSHSLLYERDIYIYIVGLTNASIKFYRSSFHSFFSIFSSFSLSLFVSLSAWSFFLSLLFFHGRDLPSARINQTGASKRSTLIYLSSLLRRD